MNFRNLTLTGAALLLASPLFASTYYGGFEDRQNGDYDYNDIVFSISGTGLTLQTTDGAWYNKPVLGTSGTPFWNNASYDGSKMNVGYCIYGGGNCNSGTGLAPTDAYLASKTSPSKAANSVEFTVDPNNKGVSTSVLLQIAGDTDVLGWTDGTHSGYFTGSKSGAYTFTPAGSTFWLFGTDVSTKATYSSMDCTPSDPSHFAFFGPTTPTPEPGTFGAMAGGLIAIGAAMRRRFLRS